MIGKFYQVLEDYKWLTIRKMDLADFFKYKKKEIWSLCFWGFILLTGTFTSIRSMVLGCLRHVYV
jgi:hypothetical protein